MKLNKFEQVISLLNISFGKSDNQNFKPFSIKEWSNFAKYCLDNKKNVLVEKPLLTKKKELIKLHRSAKKNKVISEFRLLIL